MDARLQKALDHANYRQTLGIERQRLKDTSLASLVIAYNGGIFTCNKTLIGFINSIKDYGPVVDHGSAVILDDNDYPIEIKNLQEFLDQVIGTYFEITNEYYQHYAALKQKRTVAKLVEL